MKKYTTYEEPLKGRTFTESQIKKVYRVLANKEEYATFEDWLFDMLKSGVFEEMKEEIKIISGTFETGCGITVEDENYNFYHLLVVADRKTNKPCVELRDKVYFEEDMQ